MQAQPDGRIKAGQAHGNRIAMRFFLFCLRERACGSPRRMPQAQAHTVPSKSPASAPRSLFRRRSGGQTPFRRRLILPKRSRCDPKRPCGKSRTRPFSPTGESLRQPVRQSISAAPPTAERLRRFCNASSGFLRMKRTVPAAVPRKHPHTGIRCSAAVQSSGPFGSGSVRETSNSGPHFQASPVKTCPAETPRQQQPHTAAPAHAAPP